MKKIFRGRIEKGKLVLQQQEAFNLFVWSLNDKEVELTIGRPTKPRSNQQSRYYWGVVIKILSDHIGYTPEEMHDALRMKFLSLNKELPTLRSTTELSTVEFEVYVSQIRMWASSYMSTYIPTPNEVEY